MRAGTNAGANALEFRDGKLLILDQRALPHKLKWVRCETVRYVADAIRAMAVRGAPAIGIAAAYGMALSKSKTGSGIKNDAELLKAARPTAVDLAHAVDHVSGAKNMPLAAHEWDGMIREKCRKISENGAKLIGDGAKVHTHCNTGFLATGYYGSALGAIKEAWRQGKKIFVYVDETRPRFQGALTSWELLREGVPHGIITDSMAGSFMACGKISLSMAGADRIAANGDFANKIGTYPVAVLAKENKIPFYVLAPISTFDFGIKGGNEIKIEYRDEREVLGVLSVSGKRIYPKGARALNPSFDVTPEKYVSAYVTEFGIHKNIAEVKKFWKNTKG